MAIVQLYSKRKRALERAESDVYSYDSIPETVRSQLKQMFGEVSTGYSRAFERHRKFQLDANDFEQIVKVLRREHGKDKLCRFSRGYQEELLQYISACETDEFLDCAELFGVLAEGAPNGAEHIHELNHRLREAGLGYEFVGDQIIRVDSKILHAEVLKPTLLLLSSKKAYEGAEQEILHAFEKFRHHDNKGAVTEALKAFESTMKAILEMREWQYAPNDPAARLIAACFSNGLIPAYLQTHFGALKTMLESGVPTVRNKTSGHGQGTAVSPLPDHYASYVLYTALANMKLMIECEEALP
ncbi:hypothetical protein U5903_04105 [Cereibacter johrii]|uniref:STM4504/CBY_0614 family protein n=1 Tax=Cereibacter johrii TaxID=445629 RepID=UPI002B2605BB|nr:hypothetical protein [Cereibacter johrii]MEA5159951.1 hypothetical protein [Cereibacter johrii]